MNPVLREGNSDRRAARPVKENAKKIEKRSPGTNELLINIRIKDSVYATFV